MKRMTYLVVGVLLACGVAVQGTNRYVSLTGNSASPYTNWADAATNIQDAVNVSGAGDIIYITNGTYTLTNQISIEYGKSITLEGYNGSSNTFVNGNYPHTTNRCFYINEDACIISGLTISNGYAATASLSGNGGGLYTRCLIRNCVISDNTAQGDGGGIYFVATATITNSTITRNSAVSGGGVRSSYGLPVQIRNCMINSNSSTAMGAGIYLELGTVANSIISNNSSVSGPGGLYVSYSTIVRNCVIVQNTGANGGGMRCDGTPTVENCLIMNNRAGDGAAIWSYCNGEMRNCTVVSNAATGSGGGLYAYFLDFKLINTIVYSNTPQNYAVYAGSVTFTNSCMPGLSGSGNISGYPQFADWPNNNYRLTAHSPCVNTGANQDWMTNSVDLDGRLRIDRINGRVDIGAYELSRVITLISAH